MNGKRVVPNWDGQRLQMVFDVDVCSRFDRGRWLQSPAPGCCSFYAIWEGRRKPQHQAQSLSRYYVDIQHPSTQYGACIQLSIHVIVLT